MFTILLILTWSLRYPQKTGVKIKKGMRWNRKLRHLCTLVMGLPENSMRRLSTVFLVIKKNSFLILYFLLSRDYWILLIYPSYGSNSRKRYTLRLFSMCLERRVLEVALPGRKWNTYGTGFPGGPGVGGNYTN